MFETHGHPTENTLIVNECSESDISGSAYPGDQFCDGQELFGTCARITHCGESGCIELCDLPADPLILEPSEAHQVLEAYRYIHNLRRGSSFRRVIDANKTDESPTNKCTHVVNPSRIDSKCGFLFTGHLGPRNSMLGMTILEPSKRSKSTASGVLVDSAGAFCTAI